MHVFWSARKLSHFARFLNNTRQTLVYQRLAGIVCRWNSLRCISRKLVQTARIRHIGSWNLNTDKRIAVGKSNACRRISHLFAYGDIPSLQCRSPAVARAKSPLAWRSSQLTDLSKNPDCSPRLDHFDRGIGLLVGTQQRVNTGVVKFPIFENAVAQRAFEDKTRLF